VLPDTHIALWLDSGDDHLRPSTHALIDGRWQNGGTICRSAVNVWEIALLVDNRRIELDFRSRRGSHDFSNGPATGQPTPSSKTSRHSPVWPRCAGYPA